MRDTGIGIYDPLFFIGVVENKSDGRLEGRVQVRAFGVHGTVDQVPTENLPWATLIHGSYDPNAPIPPVNSFVFGFFVDGRDAQQPMILGLIPTQMTEILDPAVTGWGKIPIEDAEVLSRGSNADDYGQPANSKLARGEYIQETYVLKQAVSRIKDIPVAKYSDDEEIAGWSEPPPAYDAVYPFNRVIETASHSIELDDTPGSERIMISHNKSGSYVCIDSNGTTVNKSASDKYEVNDSHQHVYVGGKSNVTVAGDCRVLVQGNKIEEIVGNYTQIVHGNHMISVAGQMNLNAGEEVQMRGAQLRLESNVAGINLKSAKGIFASSGESIHLKSGIAIFQEARNSFNIKAGDNIYIEAGGDGNIKAKKVNIDDIVNMANGDAAEATGADDSASTEMPQPATKSASTTKYKNTGSTGTSGYASRDEGFTEDTAPDSEDDREKVPGEVPPGVGKSSPVGSPLTLEQEEAAWKALEEKEKSKRLAAGLPAEFTDSERKTLKGIMYAEGGDQAGNLAVVLNRSYQAKAPVDQIVMASSQFTPATSYLTGYSDQVAGVDEGGFKRFVGAYTSPATSSFADAVTRYDSIPGADTVNFFIGAGLPVRYGDLNYTAGNKYSSGPGGRYFATGGSSNIAKLNEYLEKNGY